MRGEGAVAVAEADVDFVPAGPLGRPGAEAVVLGRSLELQDDVRGVQFHVDRVVEAAREDVGLARFGVEEALVEEHVGRRAPHEGLARERVGRVALADRGDRAGDDVRNGDLRPDRVVGAGRGRAPARLPEAVGAGAGQGLGRRVFERAGNGFADVVRNRGGEVVGLAGHEAGDRDFEVAVRRDRDGRRAERKRFAREAVGHAHVRARVRAEGADAHERDRRGGVGARLGRDDLRVREAVLRLDREPDDDRAGAAGRAGIAVEGVVVDFRAAAAAAAEAGAARFVADPVGEVLAPAVAADAVAALAGHAEVAVDGARAAAGAIHLERAGNVAPAAGAAGAGRQVVFARPRAGTARAAAAAGAVFVAGALAVEAAGVALRLVDRLGGIDRIDPLGARAARAAARVAVAGRRGVPAAVAAGAAAVGAEEFRAVGIGKDGVAAIAAGRRVLARDGRAARADRDRVGAGLEPDLLGFEVAAAAAAAAALVAARAAAADREDARPAGLGDDERIGRRAVRPGVDRVGAVRRDDRARGAGADREVGIAAEGFERAGRRRGNRGGRGGRVRRAEGPAVGRAGRETGEREVPRIARRETGRGHDPVGFGGPRHGGADFDGHAAGAAVGFDRARERRARERGLGRFGRDGEVAFRDRAPAHDHRAGAAGVAADGRRSVVGVAAGDAAAAAAAAEAVDALVVGVDRRLPALAAAAAALAAGAGRRSEPARGLVAGTGAAAAGVPDFIAGDGAREAVAAVAHEAGDRVAVHALGARAAAAADEDVVAGPVFVRDRRDARAAALVALRGIVRELGVDRRAHVLVGRARGAARAALRVADGRGVVREVAGVAGRAARAAEGADDVDARELDERGSAGPAGAAAVFLDGGFAAGAAGADRDRVGAGFEEESRLVDHAARAAARAGQAVPRAAARAAAADGEQLDPRAARGNREGSARGGVVEDRDRVGADRARFGRARRRDRDRIVVREGERTGDRGRFLAEDVHEFDRPRDGRAGREAFLDEREGISLHKARRDRLVHAADREDRGRGRGTVARPAGRAGEGRARGVLDFGRSGNEDRIDVARALEAQDQRTVAAATAVAVVPHAAGAGGVPLEAAAAAAAEAVRTLHARVAFVPAVVGAVAATALAALAGRGDGGVVAVARGAAAAGIPDFFAGDVGRAAVTAVAALGGRAGFAGRARAAAAAGANRRRRLSGEAAARVALAGYARAAQAVVVAVAVMAAAA